MKNKNISKITAVLLSLLILFQIFTPLVALAATADFDSDVIYIGNADELITLSEKCATDSWSVGKTVVLTNNISLEGFDFSPIPTFSGIFDGNHYTISGLKIDETYAPSSLFAYLGESGEIKNLKVEGSVVPDSKNVYTGGIVGVNFGSIVGCIFEGTVFGEKCVGGIAGQNTFSGTIKDCTVLGEIIGKEMTGGIVGENQGLVTSSKNGANVNAISIDPSISLDELNEALTIDITKLPTINFNTTTQDTGGIAGYSSGIILACVNYGLVGYEHIGYNVGGIAGRNCGHISECDNFGEILGRKDVGGIVGQMEPYVSLKLSEDLIARLQNELEELKKIVDDTTHSADGTNASVSSILDSILSLLESTTAEANKLAGSVTDWGDSNITEINRGSEIVDATIEKISTITGKIPAIVAKLTVSLDQLESGFASLEEAATLSTEGLEVIEQCLNKIELLIANIKDATDKINTANDNMKLALLPFSSVSAKEAIRDILDGVSILRESTAELKSTVNELNAIFENADLVTDAFAGAMNGFSSAFGTLEDASEDLTDIANDVKALLEYLDSVDPIQVQKPSEEINSSANTIYANICEIEKKLKELNSAISTAGTDLMGYVRAINDKFSEISNTIISIIYQTESDDKLLNDTSDEDIASVTNGKVYGCVNNGYVYGDINVGGISGIIGVEYEIDPEDDLSGSVSATRKRAYELKAIIQNCISYGEIITKKDCAGAVCGKMDLGLIIDSEGYGSAKSESGSYVGGIAGYCAGTVKRCFVKCTLSGNKYVGGIIGSGVTEAVMNASSKVKECYSLIVIESGKQYIGAISGDNLGIFENNFFVSDTLTGINRINYTGKAEKIEYKTLFRVESLPIEFKRFTLSFVADGNIILKKEFDYGDNFDNSIFPEIPEVEGHYGEWDITNLDNLKFDTTVTAIYFDYNTTLRSEQTRNENRPVFYVQGVFTDKDKLIVEMQPILSSGFATKYGEILAEQWKITIPNDNKSEHLIRFMFPTKSTTNLHIYVKNNGTWEKVEYNVIGSYISFSAEGNEIEIAVVTNDVAFYVVAITVLVLFLTLVTIVVIIIVKKIKKSKKNKGDISRE